jgi:hypothetical protein
MNNLLSKLDSVANNGRISKAIAMHFIEKSAWWITHPSGPVRAPGDAKNLEGPEHKPILKLGANTFKVGEALLKCRQITENYLKSARSNPDFAEKALSSLRKRLASAICSSVSAFDGRAYKQYPMEGNQMVFGAHAINVKEFIDCLFEIVPVDKFIRQKSHKHTKDDTPAEHKFSKAMKKYYRRMLSAENRFDQTENAILALQSADSLLRGEQGNAGKSIFSTLRETIQNRNPSHVRRLGSLLTSLFSHQDAAARQTENLKPVPKINSQVEALWRSAGFKIPGSG